MSSPSFYSDNEVSIRTIEVIDLSSDDEEFTKLVLGNPETVKGQKTNRRFRKRPVKVVRQDPDKIVTVTSNNKRSLKMKMRKKKNSKAEWEVEKCTVTPVDTTEHYVCDICDFYDCSSYTCMRKHERTHRLPRYVCNLCQRRFFTKGDLTTHHQAEHTKVPCAVCSVLYPKTRLSEHMRLRHFTELKYTCSQCDKSYVQLHSLRKHVKKHHSTRLSREEPAPLQGKSPTPDPAETWERENAEPLTIWSRGTKYSFHCSQCPKSYVQQHSLKSHVEKHHPTASWEELLGIHDQVFSSDPLSLEAWENAVPLDTVSQGTEYNFHCSQCPKSYVQQHSLRSHVEKHHTTKSMEIQLEEF